MRIFGRLLATEISLTDTCAVEFDLL